MRAPSSTTHNHPGIKKLVIHLLSTIIYLDDIIVYQSKSSSSSSFSTSFSGCSCSCSSTIRIKSLYIPDYTSGISISGQAFQNKHNRPFSVLLVQKPSHFDLKLPRLAAFVEIAMVVVFSFEEECLKCCCTMTQIQCIHIHIVIPHCNGVTWFKLGTCMQCISHHTFMIVPSFNSVMV